MSSEAKSDLTSTTGEATLSGRLVLDLTRYLSGPYCTLLLAGLGAEVVKVDDPREGDLTASAPPFAGPRGVGLTPRTGADLGLAYLKRQRGKRSITINLKDPEGLGLLTGLVEHADVLVENFRPGVARRLGIDYETLAPRNPGLVYCAITGYGSTGPDRDLKSYDLMAQAASGLMSVTGEPEGPPSKTATAFSDMLAGTYAALGITAALHERERSGRGQAVDVSMVECLFTMMMDEPFDWYERLGLASRQGNRIMRFSPFNAYRTTDGWVVVGTVSNEEWRRLLQVMNRPDLHQRPETSDVGWRIVNSAEIDAHVEAWTRTLTTAEVVTRLNASDVPCAPVRTPEEAIAWPHLRERGAVVPVRMTDGQPLDAVAGELPLQFSRSKAGHDRPAPVPGADTDAVLHEYLNLTPDRLDALRAKGTI